MSDPITDNMDIVCQNPQFPVLTVLRRLQDVPENDTIVALYSTMTGWEAWPQGGRTVFLPDTLVLTDTGLCVLLTTVIGIPELQYLKTKESAQCKWTMDRDGVTGFRKYWTECQEMHETRYDVILEEGFRFCPFCGKPIGEVTT